jgi:DNA-3-methyladenine glycosylase
MSGRSSRARNALTPGAVLPRAALAGPTLDACRALLGARLVRQDDAGERVGRIVEVEAYIGTDDLASHARFGRTARNAVMFGPPGRAYVYLVYGMYECLNVVTEADGRAAAVLIRAVEPLEGVDAIRDARIAWALRRSRATPASADRIRALPADRLASGPGLVTVAFGIDRNDTGADLLDPTSRLRLESRAPGERPPVIETSPRIGIDYAASPWREQAWRFVDAGSPSVSGPRPRRNE